MLLNFMTFRRLPAQRLSSLVREGAHTLMPLNIFYPLSVTHALCSRANNALRIHDIVARNTAPRMFCRMCQLRWCAKVQVSAFLLRFSKHRGGLLKVACERIDQKKFSVTQMFYSASKCLYFYSSSILASFSGQPTLILKTCSVNDGPRCYWQKL